MTRLLTCLHCRRSVSVDDRDSFEPSTPWERDYGSPTPLGVSWVVYDQARNFALFSRHARRVWLQLYSADDAATPIFETELQPLCNKTGPIWHCRLPLSTAPAATHYAYRVAGPGPGFDSAKILVDPYAKSTYFPPPSSIGMQPDARAATRGRPRSVCSTTASAVMGSRGQPQGTAPSS